MMLAAVDVLSGSAQEGTRMFGKGFGLPEILIILVIILLLFGATRLPQLASALGRSIKEFKNGANTASADETANAKPDEGKSTGGTKGMQH